MYPATKILCSYSFMCACECEYVKDLSIEQCKRDVAIKHCTH